MTKDYLVSTLDRNQKQRAKHKAKEISDINDKARALGMSYGQYVSMMEAPRLHRDSVEYMEKKKERKKCKDCDACKKGYIRRKPNAYVCIGVKSPFIIDDINNPCTEYDLLNTT